MRTDTTNTMAASGTPTASANPSSSKEDTMTPAPIHGAPTDSANPSPPTAPSESRKKERAKPFSPKPLEALAQKAKARAAGTAHAMVQEDTGVLDAHLVALDDVSTEVAQAAGTEARIRAELAQSVRGIRPALLAVSWVLRALPGGRRFVQDRKERSELATAERLLAALPKSDYDLPRPLVHKLEAVVAPARQHLDAWTTASKTLATAQSSFMVTSVATRAAITTLRSSVQRAKVSARLQARAASARKVSGRKHA
jgi:hypothetical protein